MLHRKKRYDFFIFNKNTLIKMALAVVCGRHMDLSVGWKGEGMG
jgi:hypothetical protein